MPGTDSLPVEVQCEMANQSQIETYIRDNFARQDELLRGFADRLQAAGMPTIQVPPELGKMLSLLVHITNATRVLEIGTLGGYSATWMARALPDHGKLTTLEIEPKHADFARKFLQEAGVGNKVDVLLGPAEETLRKLAQEEMPPFDLVFIDADKVSYPAYLEWAMKLTRVGSVIVADNVLRGGNVIRPSDDPYMEGIARYNEMVATSPNLESLLIPNRGGSDGYIISVVTGE